MKHTEGVWQHPGPAAQRAAGKRPTARRYRTTGIQAGEHVITAASPLPDDLRQALDLIHGH